KYIHILSFLALITCGNLGNAEKRINSTTKSTHIGKSKDYFKNRYYPADAIYDKCIDEASKDFDEETGRDLVEMRDCSYEQIPRIEAEILKKAKLLNKENVYTSSWIAKKKKVIDRKCTKKYQNQGQIGDINIAVCLSNGMYALGKSIK
ncbi:MAG: hypothetical protein WDW20_06545, partial [Neisseriaceae bacterium]